MGDDIKGANPFNKNSLITISFATKNKWSKANKIISQLNFLDLNRVKIDPDFVPGEPDPFLGQVRLDSSPVLVREDPRHIRRQNVAILVPRTRHRLGEFSDDQAIWDLSRVSGQVDSETIVNTKQTFDSGYASV